MILQFINVTKQLILLTLIKLIYPIIKFFGVFLNTIVSSKILLFII
jgi:hypothetical protein